MSQYPVFVELSRQPALKTKGTTQDPTIRDSYENGMISSRPRFRRTVRTWTVTIEYLTPDDVTALDEFVRDVAVYGANIFLFPDNRDPRNPVEYSVRFASLPKYDDAGWIEDSFRQNVTFELAEV